MKDSQRKTVMRLLGVVSCVLLVGFAVQPAQAGKNPRYDCGTFSNEKLVQLPVAPLNAETGRVTIIFHGEEMKALYTRKGLKQYWNITDKIYIELSPTMTALYWDFTGAKEGELRKPEAVFPKCTKHG